MARALRPTKASTANIEAMANPIIIAGEARTRWAPAPRPTADDYRSRWDGERQARANNLGTGSSYWWVTARPGEAALLGAILVAEAANGDTKIIPVPPLWVGRWAARVPSLVAFADDFLNAA